MKNLYRRLALLERDIISDPIMLQMPDGRTVKLPGGNDHVIDLLARACRTDRTPEMNLIARSISSTEPGGGQIDLARALLNGPTDGK